MGLIPNKARPPELGFTHACVDGSVAGESPLNEIEFYPRVCGFSVFIRELTSITERSESSNGEVSHSDYQVEIECNQRR